MGAQPGEMTPEEAQRAQEVMTFLNDFVPTAWAFFRECQNNPRSDSFVARAKQDADLVLVLDAALWVDAAGAFFLTGVKDFEHGRHRFSPYTSMRAALECGAVACLRPDPDA